MPGPPTAVPAWTPGKQVREEVSEAIGGRKKAKPACFSIMLSHVWSSVINLRSSKWQMQFGSILILLPASAVTCMPEIWDKLFNSFSLFVFSSWVFPRMAFQTTPHRIHVAGGETPKARQKEGIWWLLVG